MLTRDASLLGLLAQAEPGRQQPCRTVAAAAATSGGVGQSRLLVSALWGARRKCNRRTASRLEDHCALCAQISDFDLHWHLTVSQLGMGKLEEVEEKANKQM